MRFNRLGGIERRLLLQTCFRVKFFALTRIRIRIGSEGVTDSSGVTIQLKDSPGGRRRLVLLVTS